MKTLEQIVDQLLRTESLAARAGWFVTAAITVWLTTSVLALFFRSPEFFSRAGAVGTGLVLATFAIAASARQSYHTHLLKGLVLAMRANLRDREGRPLAMPDAEPEDHEAAARDYDHNLEAIGRLFARLDRRSNPARVTEVGAALVSTLQWGYGDLVINRLMLCGAWKC